MKTAVSIPEELFHKAEDVGKRLGMNRSQLYRAAIAEFLERHRQDKVTEQLNAAYKDQPSDPDPVLSAMQFASLPKEDWV